MGSQDNVSRWRYQPANGIHTYTRKEPTINSERTKIKVMPGEVVSVVEERRGEQGVTFLRIANGTGWMFDSKPGVGTMCVKVEDSPAPLPQPAPEAAAREPAGGSGGGRAGPPEEQPKRPPQRAAAAEAPSQRGAAASPDAREGEEEAAPSRLGAFASMLGLAGRPAKETPPEAPPDDARASAQQPAARAAASGRVDRSAGEVVERAALNEHVQKACEAIVKATVEEQVKIGFRQVKAEFNAQLATLKEQMQAREKRYRQELDTLRDMSSEASERAKPQLGAGAEPVSQQVTSELVALAHHQSQLRHAQQTLESRITAIEEMGLQERLMAAAADAAESAAVLLASRTVRLEDAVAPLACRVRALEREALGAPGAPGAARGGAPPSGSPPGGAAAFPRVGSPAGKGRTLLDFGPLGPGFGKNPVAAAARTGGSSNLML